MMKIVTGKAGVWIDCHPCLPAGGRQKPDKFFGH
jgi:hypothetical protein